VSLPGFDSVQPFSWLNLFKRSAPQINLTGGRAFRQILPELFFFGVFRPFFFKERDEPGSSTFSIRQVFYFREAGILFLGGIGPSFLKKA
jgi:hypothetical protein